MTSLSVFTQDLTTKGNLVFPANEQHASQILNLFNEFSSETQTSGSTLYWRKNQSGDNQTLQIQIYPTGHRVYYNQNGQRFLCVDPKGHALHEASWEDKQGSRPLLLNARMQLDSKQWVGIKPRAKTFKTPIDISKQPGWQQMTLDDLRRGASQAWNVPFSEVKYFYKDENFVQTTPGQYDVSLTKDGLYVLIDGDFEKPIFISHLFAVQWDKLDLIPVVELFQSALAGAGGAVFEFVWGIYDDQSRVNELPPLKYRGLPTYPSKEAFNIFSAFFEPSLASDEKAEDKVLPVFMDPDRSHEVSWNPRSTPPWRYFCDDNKISLTVQDEFLYKVSVWDDEDALPYINPAKGAMGPCDRDLKVKDGQLILREGEKTRALPLNKEWNVKNDPPREKKNTPPPLSWQDFFIEGVPKTDPTKMLYTVPFYPEGQGEIDESSIQPMVLDQIFYYMEKNEEMEEKLQKVQTVLIHTFDTTLSGLIDCQQQREYSVLYSDSEFAKKNAQLLWNHAASLGKLDNLKQVQFLKESENVETAYQKKYDMIFKWIPFLFHPDRETSEAILMSLAQALNPGGLLFLQGPAPLAGLFEHHGLKIINQNYVDEMPFFHQHLKLCPENRIAPNVTVFFAQPA